VTRRLPIYGLIAGLCALINVAILVGGDRIGLHFAVSTTLSFVACVLLGYVLHCYFTFGEAVSRSGLAYYTLAMALNYPISLFGLWLLHEFMGAPMTVAAPALTFTLAAYNFVSSRWAVVRSKLSR